jgi:NAD(P)-dependent dehydrogenase (short-subunit alcohol dehydrogenase family)
VAALVNNAGRIPGDDRELAPGGKMEAAFAIMGNGTFLLTGLLRPVRAS